ncbi:MAG: SDR family NAD(P)-dependent oxidoreductase, partial [Chloroflexi bacterium]|nr:SDR family NAD(P)-dependent oxidoreductase [Chloroflexota bacterium]
MMFPSEFDVTGKTVIVTGAARGIGKGIARVFAEAGAQVMVTSLTDRYLTPLAGEMEAAGHPILPLTADATNSGDWQGTVDTAMDAWGRIDVLVNNLGDAIRKP